MDEVARPGVSSLLRLLTAVGGDASQRFPDKVALKSAVFDAVSSALSPIRQRAAKISDADVEAALREGARRAQLLAAPVLERAMQAARLHKT